MDCSCPDSLVFNRKSRKHLGDHHELECDYFMDMHPYDKTETMAHDPSYESAANIT